MIHSPHMFAYRILFLAASSFMLGCCSGSSILNLKNDSITDSLEDSGDQTFLGNCKSLRDSDGFRQNCWLSSKQLTIGAICMDLNRHLYLVVDTDSPIRSEELISPRFKNLRDSAATLRKKMDSEAFILDRQGIDWISRIPIEAKDTFPSELLHELTGVKIKSADIRYGWD